MKIALAFIRRFPFTKRALRARVCLPTKAKTLITPQQKGFLVFYDLSGFISPYFLGCQKSTIQNENRSNDIPPPLLLTGKNVVNGVNTPKWVIDKERCLRMTLQSLPPPLSLTGQMRHRQGGVSTTSPFFFMQNMRT